MKKKNLNPSSPRKAGAPKKILQLEPQINSLLSPEDVFQFIHDYQSLMSGQLQKSKLISLRVPENLLKLFKIKANSQDVKYQTQIIRLMARWLGEA